MSRQERATRRVHTRWHIRSVDSCLGLLAHWITWKRSRFHLLAMPQVVLGYVVLRVCVPDPDRDMEWALDSVGPNADSLEAYPAC